MRLVWVVIPLVLIVSMIGIVGVGESFGPPLERIPIFNIIVSGIDGSTTIRSNEHTTIMAEYREDYPNIDYVIIFQIKNEKGQVVLLNWIEKIQKNFVDHPGSYLCGGKLCYDEQAKSESYVCGDQICKSEIPDSKFVETSWFPSESGTYTMTVFSWEAIDNPTAWSPPISRTVTVTSDVSNIDFSKIIVDNFTRSHSDLAGVPLVYFNSLEYPEFVKIGDEFDVNVKWTFTEYDEEGNVEHQYIPLNTLTREIFDESILQIKIPENIQMITNVSDWEKTEKIHYDSSYNFNSTFTTFSKTTPFDYTNAMHEQTYQFKLVGPFFPPFDTMTFGGLGFGKIIYHQDGSLLHDNLDPKFIQKSQSEITVEKLGIENPQYPEVPPSEVNWKKASDVIPKGINTPVDTNTISSQCSLVHGVWIDEYDECVPREFPLESCRDGLCQERFENFCSEFNGEYYSCHSGCRHSPDWPNVICAAVCEKVCEFK